MCQEEDNVKHDCCWYSMQPNSLSSASSTCSEADGWSAREQRRYVDGRQTSQNPIMHWKCRVSWKII